MRSGKRQKAFTAACGCCMVSGSILFTHSDMCWRCRLSATSQLCPRCKEKDTYRVDWPWGQVIWTMWARTGALTLVAEGHTVRSREKFCRAGDHDERRTRKF